MANRNGKRVSITLKEEIIEALNRIAKEEQRDRNSLIRRIIVEYIEERSRLERQEDYFTKIRSMAKKYEGRTLIEVVDLCANTSEEKEIAEILKFNNMLLEDDEKEKKDENE